MERSRIAHRPPGKLVLFLALGGVAALWMIALPEVLKGGVYQSLPLKVRIPMLALILCLPVAFTLSLLTPLAIRIGVPNVASTGRVAGLIFALSTLGCLLGNYLTGFVLIPEFPINTIVAMVAGLLVLTACGVAARRALSSPQLELTQKPSASTTHADVMPLGIGFAIVFMCSFAGMSLEISASRLIALLLGNSLYTWTGVIGVMLFGTACGNFLGGRIADRAGRSPSPGRGETSLGWTLLVAGITGVLVIVASVSSPVPSRIRGSGCVNKSSPRLSHSSLHRCSASAWSRPRSSDCVSPTCRVPAAPRAASTP